MSEVLAYIGVGAFAGFVAGLLGVGGGLIIVPVLALVFAGSHFPDAIIMPLALGTSLASIVFTSMSSLGAHHRHGAVHWAIVRRITPGIVTGALLGTVVATRLPMAYLVGFFAAFLFYAGTQMMLGLRPRPTRRLPGRAGLFAAGGLIGSVSALVGIGGGTLSVPFLVWCNIRVHEAIGTSAAIGLPIALAGGAGYLINGLVMQGGLPEGSIGFIYLPALAGIVTASVLTAPLGARLAHRLPVAPLKRIFAVLLYLLALRMLWRLLAA